MSAKDLFDAILEEYPTGWNKEHFKSMSSFAKRKAYCDARLRTRLGAGSARIVYQIDGEKVLKLAANAKGQGQNEQEYEMYNDGYLQNHPARQLLARVFDADTEEFNWIEMELVEHATSADFERYFGIKYKDFVDVITYWGRRMHGAEEGMAVPKMWNELNDNTDKHPWWEWITDIGNNFDYEPADWKRLSSWGKTRDGRLVIVDFGLTSDVYSAHYAKESAGVKR